MSYDPKGQPGHVPPMQQLPAMQPPVAAMPTTPPAAVTPGQPAGAAGTATPAATGVTALLDTYIIMDKVAPDKLERVDKRIAEKYLEFMKAKALADKVRKEAKDPKDRAVEKVEKDETKALAALMDELKEKKPNGKKPDEITADLKKLEESLKAGGPEVEAKELEVLRSTLLAESKGIFVHSTGSKVEALEKAQASGDKDRYEKAYKKLEEKVDGHSRTEHLPHDRKKAVVDALARDPKKAVDDHDKHNPVAKTVSDVADKAGKIGGDILKGAVNGVVPGATAVAGAVTTAVTNPSAPPTGIPMPPAPIRR